MDDKRLDEILNQLKDNPSNQDDWRILRSLDADSMTADFNIPPEQIDGLNAKSNLILKEAINEVDSDANSEQPKPSMKKQQRKRIWVIASMAASLLIMFLTLTSSGRAIARPIYEAVVTFLGGEIHMEMQVPEGSVPENTDFESATFNNMDEAAEFLGYPLIDITDNNISVNEAD